MTKVSVILPVYNVEEYLSQALDSITNQTLKDIEIICVNDGSKDNSLNILEEYASKDDRIKIINQENQGQGAARNNAIEIAKGEYLSFVDPDDWVELDMLEKLYNKAVENSADLIEFSYYRNNDLRNSVQKKKIKLKLPSNSVIKALDYPQYIFQAPRYPWNKLFKSELIREHNIRFGQGRWHEDQNLVISARALANKVLYCPNDYLYHYRVRLNSSSYKVNMDVLKKVELVKDLKEFLTSKGIFQSIETFYNKYAIDGIMDSYRRVPDEYKINFDKDVKDFLSENQYAIYEKKKNRSKHFLENIFAIKKMFIKGNLFKVVIILGKPIPLHKIF